VCCCQQYAPALTGRVLSQAGSTCNAAASVASRCCLYRTAPCATVVTVHSATEQSTALAAAGLLQYQSQIPPVGSQRRSRPQQTANLQARHGAKISMH
jgi:hypothetical protein